MNAGELTTKDKILKIAHNLFAQNGVDSVSIRTIAKEADVNIAAVNYHFGNKETLYIETVRFSMNKTKNDIESIYNELGENVSTKLLSSHIFNYFITNKHDLQTGFKLFFSSGIKFDSNVYDYDDQLIGPPGGEFLYYTLKKEVPHAKDKDIVWAVRTIFSHLIHKALLVCNHSQAIENKFGLNQSDHLEEALRLVRIVIDEVRQS